jgi:hypothetical protein
MMEPLDRSLFFIGGLYAGLFRKDVCNSDSAFFIAVYIAWYASMVFNDE